jgi:hypothetical protein
LRLTAKAFLCGIAPVRRGARQDAFALQHKCVSDLGGDGIGLVVEAPQAGAEVSWGSELEILPGALNLNARVALASSALGDVLLGALLADGSDPVALPKHDPGTLSMWIGSLDV